MSPWAAPPRHHLRQRRQRLQHLPPQHTHAMASSSAAAQIASNAGRLRRLAAISHRLRPTSGDPHDDSIGRDSNVSPSPAAAAASSFLSTKRGAQASSLASRCGSTAVGSPACGPTGRPSSALSIASHGSSTSSLDRPLGSSSKLSQQQQHQRPRTRAGGNRSGSTGGGGIAHGRPASVPLTAIAGGGAPSSPSPLNLLVQGTQGPAKGELMTSPYDFFAMQRAQVVDAMNVAAGDEASSSGGGGGHGEGVDGWMPTRYVIGAHEARSALRRSHRHRTAMAAGIMGGGGGNNSSEDIHKSQDQREYERAHRSDDVAISGLGARLGAFNPRAEMPSGAWRGAVRPEA